MRRLVLVLLLVVAVASNLNPDRSLQDPVRVALIQAEEGFFDANSGTEFSIDGRAVAGTLLGARLEPVGWSVTVVVRLSRNGWNAGPTCLLSSHSLCTNSVRTNGSE